jgi:hypothetical protein
MVREAGWFDAKTTRRKEEEAEGKNEFTYVLWTSNRLRNAFFNCLFGPLRLCVKSVAWGRVERLDTASEANYPNHAPDEH